MTDGDLLKTLFNELLKTGNNGLLLLMFGAWLIKRYIINGSITRFFSLKEQEIKSLSLLETSLEEVIHEQQKLYEKFCAEDTSRTSLIRKERINDSV